LHESPPQGRDEFQVNNSNQLLVANQGRQPGLQLNRNGQAITLHDWAHNILYEMQAICAILDRGSLDRPYQLALQHQLAVVDNPALTPSARILACMRENGQEFGCFASNTSALHKHYFNAEPLDDETQRLFEDMAAASLKKQADIEANDKLDFDEYLTRYFAQS